MPSNISEAQLAIINRITTLLVELATDGDAPEPEMKDHFSRVAELIAEDLGLEVIDLQDGVVTAKITPLDGWF